jgi:hypothetical protein
MVAASISTHAQTSPWQTLYEGPPGQVYSALLDPFADHPQPSLFFGGLPYDGSDSTNTGERQQYFRLKAPER